MRLWPARLVYGVAVAIRRSGERPVPVLYLDIDGTVRHGPDERAGQFVNSPDDVVVFAEAVVMMRRWKKAGGRIVGGSNQGGIALGLVDPVEVAKAMAETNRQTGNLFDRLLWCPHHPYASNPEMARCWCRKPSPGLMIEGALSLGRRHGEYYPPHMGLLVGDRDEDQECARLAGLDFLPAAEWRAAAGAVFLCPRCLMLSTNPGDVEHGYCGACHDFTGADAGGLTPQPPPGEGQTPYL